MNNTFWHSEIEVHLIAADVCLSNRFQEEKNRIGIASARIRKALEIASPEQIEEIKTFCNRWGISL